MGEPRSPWLLRYMFPQLGLLPPRRQAGPRVTQQQIMWSVRGEPRTRQTFADPHPLDYPGGLPQPAEYPT